MSPVTSLNKPQNSSASLSNHCSLYTETQHSVIPVLTFIPKRNANVQDLENRVEYTKYYVKQKELSNTFLKPTIKKYLVKNYGYQ